MTRVVTIDTNRAGATTRNMRNDELKEFSSLILKSLRDQGEWHQGVARVCARHSHDLEGQEKADWETACVEHNRRAFAYEQAVALIEATIK